MRATVKTLRPGFTLVELLVVISIIGLLVSLLLPALGAARDSARMATCAAQEQGIGRALFNYAADFNDYTPNEPPQDGDAPLDPNASRPHAGVGIMGPRWRDSTNWNVRKAQSAGGQQQSIPVGLGQLILGEVTASTASGPAKDVTFKQAGYLQSIKALVCPNATQFQYNNRSFGSSLEKSYFHPSVLDNWNKGYDASWKTNNGGGAAGGWRGCRVDTGAGGDTNTNFQGAYAYRGADYGFIDSAGALAYDSNIAAAQDGNGIAYNFKYLKMSSPGKNAKSLVAEFFIATNVGSNQWGAHLTQGGGNVLWGDGAVSFWRDADLIRARYTTNAGATMSNGVVVTPFQPGPSNLAGLGGAATPLGSAGFKLTYYMAAIDFYVRGITNPP